VKSPFHSVETIETTASLGEATSIAGACDGNLGLLADVGISTGVWVAEFTPECKKIMDS